MPIQDIFPSPVGRYELDSDLNSIQEWCYSEAQKSEGRKYSNVSGWQSESYYPDDIVDTPLFNLFYNIKKISFEIYKSLGIKNEPLIWDSWVNINPPGGYNRVHVHPRCRVAGVFWVKTSNSPASGNLTFFRNNSYEVGSISDDHTTQYSNSIATFYPVENNLVLFPAYMQHHVEQNQTDEDRISISFNML
tara:strand:- start:57 stop:629 length:573 start_codon:yes stop_codon:yes gene_type:complete